MPTLAEKLAARAQALIDKNSSGGNNASAQNTAKKESVYTHLPESIPKEAQKDTLPNQSIGSKAENVSISRESSYNQGAREIPEHARSIAIPVLPKREDAREVIKTFVETETRKRSLKEILEEKKRAQQEAAIAMEPPPVLSSEHTIDPLAETEEYTGAFSLNITLNEKQLLAKEMALQGKSFCLIGAAGTGKTTAQRSVAETLLQTKQLRSSQFKIAGSSPKQYAEAPSIAFVAYTRRASANLQRAIHKNPELEEQLKYNVMTIHALLEFEPVEFWDAEKDKMSMRFEPQRTAKNPLTITHLVIEEASMLGLDLWNQLYEALPVGVQIIFIGDINQLPPVFGASILNYALVQLPIVELTEVYRQQGDSLVLANAHNILAGKTLEEGKGFTIVRGRNPTQVGQEKMAQTLGAMFKQWHSISYYDPDDCIILSPYNKQALGTDNMNKWIAQFLGEKRNAVVFEVIAGFNKLYLAVGDKVMYNKQDAWIVDIKRNGMYHGKEPQTPGPDLSRFGVRIIGHASNGEGGADLDDILLGYENFSLEELANQDSERKMQCTHIVSIETETGQKIDLTAAGDFSPQVFSLGYVLTVHKAQGCEWKKVFIILHKDHSNMLTRELFYTAVTRAREDVILIAKDSIFAKAIATQRIKGNSLEDKIEYFNSGALDAGFVQCTKG
jgi:ATP-dependent exoDNAse (exonuclease V) alpha subunit